MKRVVIESPFAGGAAQRKRNMAYLRAAMADCLSRDEAPFASHALYTQPGVLNDLIPAERHKGIMAGFEWGRLADATVVYADLGVSEGMSAGIANAVSEGRPVEYRSLPGWGAE
ncbi:DUF7768 domain-containing protein [Amorphus orientalis]|uniref:DUF7768 domain-containing protein n=1 Tax=Amorphus orientalis TaxID=649198 RepID=A0AAE4AUT0_9HYPH|nr:hypothetical protein [Amorphus orientalis]MDQ0317745.1 hypothetical protein [Amorphus orientalis]